MQIWGVRKQEFTCLFKFPYLRSCFLLSPYCNSLLADDLEMYAIVYGKVAPLIIYATLKTAFCEYFTGRAKNIVNLKVNLNAYIVSFIQLYVK